MLQHYCQLFRITASAESLHPNDPSSDRDADVRSAARSKGSKQNRRAARRMPEARPAIQAMDDGVRLQAVLIESLHSMAVAGTDDTVQAHVSLLVDRVLLPALDVAHEHIRLTGMWPPSLLCCADY